MRKQGLTIAALIIAIIGLSIGFAAFSNTLTVSQGATVDPSASNLKVVFANNYYTEQVTTLDTTAVVPTAVGATGSNGTINNNAQNGPTLTGLKAAFTAPGQSVTYDLYVVNDGRLKAYLTDLVFGTTGSPAQAVSCTVATKDSNNQDIPSAQQATDSLVQAACAGISISVKIGNLSAMTSTSSLNNLELDVRDHEAVQIVITYAQGSAYVDGPMNVAFGDITLNASSVGTQQQGGGDVMASNPWISEGLTSPYVRYGASYSTNESLNHIPSTTFTIDTDEFVFGPYNYTWQEVQDALIHIDDSSFIMDVGNSVYILVEFDYGICNLTLSFDPTFSDTTSEIESALYVVTPVGGIVDLIPTIRQKTKVGHTTEYNVDEYVFVEEYWDNDENNFLYYDEVEDSAFIQMKIDGINYMWFFDSAIAESFGTTYNISNPKALTWYYLPTFDGWVEFDGTNPFDSFSFQSDKIKDHTYLARIIASFN